MTKMNINWTAKTLMNQMNKGNVNFDNAVQRNLVWDINKKSLLIHSMVYGFAIPAMYFTRDDGIYNSLDGKQRSNAICEYMLNEFALAENTPVVYDEDNNEVDISGKKFSELPEWAQDAIKDFNLTIYYYEDMTEEDMREFFRRLNNGKPLSAVELTRVKTPCLKVFQEIASHNAIQSVVSDAGRNRFTDENIAMQIYHMVTVENPDFSTKTFREWAQNVQTDDNIVNGIITALDCFYEFYTILNPVDDKKLLRTIKARTHFVSAVYYCYISKQNEKDFNDTVAGLTAFFSGNPSKSEDYNKTVGSGSAKPQAVKARKDVISNFAINGTY